MATPTGSSSKSSTAATMVSTTTSPKQQFLDAYHREHATTMRVLRCYPPDQLELRPHPRLRTAREIAWVFTTERVFFTKVLDNAFAAGIPDVSSPPPPDSWDDLLASLEKAHTDFATYVRITPDEKLTETVRFLTGPKTMGDIRRMSILWLVLHDEIHHRGQFTIYLRMAGGKVPSIYGPSGDEPWI
jgi:uncharacterized damage-inducible protein DinB